MTPFLAKAYWEDTSPFDGVTLFVPDLTTEELWQVYREAASLVDTSGVLWQCDDWHLHDGFITPAETLTAEALHKWLESPEKLMAAWQAEDYVHRAVYPDNRQWLLRFLLWESYRLSTGKLFAFDVSGPPELIEAIESRVRSVFPGPMEVEQAGEWFGRQGYTALEPSPHFKKYFADLEARGTTKPSALG